MGSDYVPKSKSEQRRMDVMKQSDYEKERDAAAEELFPVAWQTYYLAKREGFKAGADWANARAEKEIEMARNLKGEFLANQHDNINKLRIRCERLDAALLNLLRWAQENHEMPGYSEVIAEAKEALKGDGMSDKPREWLAVLETVEENEDFAKNGMG